MPEPIQLSVTVAIFGNNGLVGLATCQTCGALVLSSSGEAIDLHNEWHAPIPNGPEA